MLKHIQHQPRADQHADGGADFGFFAVAFFVHVGVQSTGHRRTETCQVSTAVTLRNVVGKAVDVFLEEVGRVLSKGEKVVLSGFGTFRVISMKGKTVKIPKTDKMVSIKTHRLPRFTPGKKLKRQVSR